MSHLVSFPKEEEKTSLVIYGSFSLILVNITLGVKRVSKLCVVCMDPRA